ncbi:N-acetyltransferase family protein [Aestuariibius sp. HNIBRBA575]|uniref:GNAT family N-acetyltransferase n=1 Tax=Aestuariibius sp. HNIBRBA575 TaxID=3233343 RepID=UPI0034A5656F
MIRPAQIEDCDDICRIWNGYIRKTAATFTTQEKDFVGISADIKRRDGAFWVAENGRQVTGFATYFPFRGGPGYAHTKEHSIMVAPSAKGQGWGGLLMKELISHAQRASVHSLFAGVSGENQGAVAFHQRIGFERVATLPEVGFKFGRWMDLVLMQKRL